MFKILFLPLIILLFPSQPTTTPEIDAYWAEASRTVSEGDFESYSALYHEDAALVNGISKTSYPISVALSRWKQGFEDTRSGKIKASVEFRFSERIHGETVAHDTGIFRYSTQAEGEEPQTVYVHFQGLLVKKNEKWLLTMEHQMAMATQEEWDEIE